MSLLFRETGTSSETRLDRLLGISAEAGLLGFLVYAAMFALSLLVGYLTDVYGCKTMWQVALVGAAIFTGLTYFVQSFAALVVVRALASGRANSEPAIRDRRRGGRRGDRQAALRRAGLAAFLDLREAVEPSEQLAGALDPLHDGDFAVLVTGWGERRANSEEFLKQWPWLGGEGGRVLLDRDVAGVGIDALSIGGWGGPEVGEPSHVALLGAGKAIVEDMRIPDELIGGRCFLSAFPVLEGCGAWTRAVAWELEEDGDGG